MKPFLFCLILFCLILVCSFLYFYKTNNIAIIKIHKYNDLKILEDNYEIILQELNYILDNGLWTNYDELHNKDIFKNNDFDEITKKLNKSKSKISKTTNKPKWKIFGLLFNKNTIEINEKLCPKTCKLLKNIPCIINAGFSCLEPNKTTEPHSDNNINFYRYQLPLIIPNGDTGFRINNEIIKYKINQPFIFNDSIHSSMKHGIILIIFVLF
jgi:hypothetical protein